MLQASIVEIKDKRLMKKILFVSIIYFYGCGVVATKQTTGPRTEYDYYNVKDQQYPIDFSKGNFILLIERADEVTHSSLLGFSLTEYKNFYLNTTERKIKTFADGNCRFNHEFATIQEIHSDTLRFHDRMIYRYALITSCGPGPSSSLADQLVHNTSTNVYMPMFKFYIYDRLNDVIYSHLYGGSSTIMHAFKAAIDQINDAK